MPEASELVVLQEQEWIHLLCKYQHLSELVYVHELMLGLATEFESESAEEFLVTFWHALLLAPEFETEPQLAPRSLALDHPLWTWQLPQPPVLVQLLGPWPELGPAYL